MKLHILIAVLTLVAKPCWGSEDSPCRPRSDVSWQSLGNDDCCSMPLRNGPMSHAVCGVGEGDCDDDSECAGILVCGTDNCPWGDADDCCMQPGQDDDYVRGLISGVLGCYQIDPNLYSTDEQNDWHYMVITWNNATDTFDWRNRAGYHWSLTPIQKGDEDWDTTKLKVGPECPYFENGHEFAAVEWEGEPGYSVVSTIKGPWGEAFLREESCGPVNPFKTPMGAPPGPKSSPSTKSGPLADHLRLFDHLFSNYNKQVGPFVTDGSGIEVKFGIAPVYLNLDQYGILKGRVWARYVWHDMRFIYDPSEFGGIKALRVDPALVWFPDITLYNRGDTIHGNIGHEAGRGSGNALIYPDGEVLVVPDAHIEAVCAEANLDDFWGMQECTLKFGSWTYDGNHIDLRFYKNAVDLDDFDKTSPVKILRNTTEREVKMYDCCEEPYPSLKFYLTLQRRFRVTEEGVIHNPRMSQAGNLDSPCSPRSDRTWKTIGNDDCCTNGIAGFCGEGEGDCDAHSECAGSLICGNDNCPWGDGDDCCMQP